MRTRINISLPAELVGRVDRICKIIHCPKANRSAAFEEAATEWCERREKQLKKAGKIK